jgi:plasmid stabilization system protein ParE
MRVYWTQEARNRLREIQAYIAKDSPRGAKQVIDRLVRRSLQLAELPNSERRVPEYPEAELRELLERPFRIIYRVTTDQIEIVSVMHYRQLLPTDVKTLSKS